jgi:CDP-diglyceride synthetase
VIASSSLKSLIIAIAAAWLCSLLLVALARRNPDMHHRLRDVPSLMYWQAGITACLCLFALSPSPVRWLLFLCGGARMVYEAASIHSGQWTANRAAAVFMTPVLPLFLMAMVLDAEASATMLVVAFFLSEVFDSFAYLGGKAFGKRHLAPNLSPNKTWEGLLTGAAVAFGVSLGLIGFSVLSLGEAIICSVTTIVFAALGDIAASFGKRLAGVKDYPTLIANQGGLLDMFDSWIYVAPMTALALQMAS